MFDCLNLHKSSFLQALLQDAPPGRFLILPAQKEEIPAPHIKSHAGHSLLLGDYNSGDCILLVNHFTTHDWFTYSLEK